MRILVLPAVLLVILIAGVLLLAAFRSPERRREARWEAASELRDGVTLVFVRHLEGTTELGRQPIAEIPADAPDWEGRYHEAMAEARSRAAAFHSESA